MSAKYNIVIEQNSTFSLPITLNNLVSNVETPMNLDGYTARAAIKKNYGDTKTIATMSINNTPLSSSGEIELSMPVSATTAIPAGSYVWDLIIVTGSVQTRILEGVAAVKSYVTV